MASIVSQVNRLIRRMAKAPAKYQSLEFRELQEMGSGFGRTVKNGVVQYSERGLNSIQKNVLKGIIEQNKGYFKVSKFQSAERRWSDDKPIKGNDRNKALSFSTYEDEKAFTDRLRRILRKVDFYYDPRNARDFIYENPEMSDEEIIEHFLNDDHVKIKVDDEEGGFTEFV